MSLRNALLPALLLMLPVLPTAALADGALVTSWTPIAPPPPTEPRVSTAAYAGAATPVTPAPVSSATAAPASAAIAPGPSIELPPEAELYANGEPLTEWYGADLPGGHADLWERIRAGFAMEEVDSSLVQRHEAWYLNRPDYVERMVDRAGRYLYHIVEEVEKRDMPTEIALLPMIESAYNPVAQSHMRAAGMWQFIPSTGRKYGLKQTWWYDGRRDVLAATQAALDYLQFLHDTFGSWELALAAYNCGEGKVQRAIDYNRKKRRPTDYAHLRLPKETRNYLPKLQAIKNIIADPKLVGIDLQPVPNRPYFTVVEAPPHIDVAMAAKLADMPVEEFRSLNPAHNRPVITPVGNHQLLVPIDKAEVFQANLESNEDPLVSWQSYELKRGEKLATVARKFDISLQRLEEVNGLSGRKRVRPGQMLLVPLEEAEVESNLDETYKHPDFQAPANDYRGRLVYRVKAGDTLSSIARRYGTTVKDIKAWNRLKSDHLQVGQRLNIWKDAKPPRRRTARG